MPKASREEVYLKVRREDGFDAFTKLKQDVSAEYKRKVAYVSGRQQLPHRGFAEGFAKNSAEGNLFA